MKMLCLLTSYTNHSCGKESAIADARHATLLLVRRGYAVYCPTLDKTNFPLDESTDYKKWHRASLSKLARCDVVVVLQNDGWKQDYDLKQMVSEAIKQTKTVTFTTFEELGRETFNV